MACWCETGGKQKSKEIADGTQSIAELTSDIEELTAKSAQLTADIETLEASVTAETAALSSATAIRDKEKAEFVADEKDMIQSITSLKGAVITLSKAHSAAQVDSLLQVIRSHAKKHNYRLAMNFVQESTSTKQHTPASGEIFGVLKQMKESFETNLAQSQKDEVNAEKEYASLKEAKTKQIAAANMQIQEKQQELGDTDQANAQAVVDKKNTEDALEADTAFLADLKSKCAVADSEYAARVKVRTEEITAVSDTINILTNEEANDSFTKSMSFIQKKLVSSNRAKAMDVLVKANKALKSPQLSTLAMAMKLDAFSKVKANIDDMVVKLKEESQDEITDRDFCIKELNTNSRQAAAKADAKGDLDAKIAQLESNIADLTAALKALNEEVTYTQVEMMKASKNREAENKEFSETVSDQRATQAILEKAVARLQQFYDKKALLQEAAPGEALAPPPEQKTYAKSAGGGGAVAMIMDVMKESKDLEQKAIVAETDAQAAYEGFVKDSNTLITANQEAIASKSEAKAKADGELALAKGDLGTTVEDILGLDEVAKNLHAQCDFLLKNFEGRQSKRAQEIDALNQAKAIFSGMK
jgi:chromosome segregation ATPase